MRVNRVKAEQLLKLFDQQQEIQAILLSVEKNRRKGVLLPCELLISHGVELLHQTQDVFADFCIEIESAD
jgi:hypothetical protein